MVVVMNDSSIFASTLNGKYRTISCFNQKYITFKPVMGSLGRVLGPFRSKLLAVELIIENEAVENSLLKDCYGGVK